MNAKILLHEIETLPPEKQEEVADFVGFLQGRFGIGSENAVSSASAERFASESATPASSSSTAAEPLDFFGMWADRDDMKDSVAYVRALREREWRIPRV